jgi:hypothetical protein
MNIDTRSAQAAAALRQRAALGGATEGRAWWRYPMVWLVVGGPAAVVVASIVTGAIAWRGADPDVRIGNTVAVPADDTAADPKSSMAPALKARNHAATPAR